MYGYFSRKDEDSHSLVSRIDTLAVVGGVIGLALGTRPYWSRLLGEGSTALMKKFVPKVIKTTAIGAFEEVAGEEDDADVDETELPSSEVPSVTDAT